MCCLRARSQYVEARRYHTESEGLGIRMRAWHMHEGATSAQDLFDYS